MMRRAEQRAPLRDRAAREAIVRERDRNLVIVAGAGTGKTTMLVDRIVDLVAPPAPRAHRVLERLAAITFTRRAAGELRFRIREALLRAYAAARTGAGDDGRAPERLLAAISQLDAAFIGTIHSFAERLLRLRPVEARISPAYELAEETGELVHETIERLRRGAEAGDLEARLGTFGAHLGPPAVADAATTLLACERIGVRVYDEQRVPFPQPSLEVLIEGMLMSRDVPLKLPAAVEPGLGRAGGAVAEMLERIGGETAAAARADAAGVGERWLRDWLSRLAGDLRAGAGDQTGARHGVDAARAADAIAVCRDLREMIKEGKAFGNGKGLQKGRHFAGAATEWQLYNLIVNGKRSQRSDLPADLETRLKAPLRWLATQLVRLQPVVLAQYEQVKAERGQIDQIDLLVKLRDLLRDRRDVRAHLQGLFDHLLIDEFQDTDPLQVEIAFFLCEQGQAAASWRSVRLQPGKLTLVGDPKQSIYRFRRADIATYKRAVDLLVEQGALEQRLSTNFRSRPELIEVFNRTLARLLGSGGEALDAATGRARYEPLEPPPPGPARGAATAPGPPPPAPGAARRAPSGGAPQAAPAVVHVVSYTDGGGEPFDRHRAKQRGRAVEAAALARYLRWLLQQPQERFAVRDPDTGEPRAVRPTDVAVLAQVTGQVPLLLRELDRLEIAYNARGGQLFFKQPVVRRMLLALRALADRDDGVAAAALLAPPFFALEPGDLHVERLARRWGDAAPAVPAAAGGDAPVVAAAAAAATTMATATAGGAGVASRLSRVAEARAIVRELRRRRAGQSPGATARDLIERTGLGRSVVWQPNGGQILASLYEIAFEMDRMARDRGADFDAATVLLREWAARPVYHEAPEPLDARAVQIMSIHQAKGLEFPVVVLWDGFAGLGRGRGPAWMIGRDRGRWALKLGVLERGEPSVRELANEAKRLDLEERKRLYYVAATRARDLLVLPHPCCKPSSRAKAGQASYASGGDGNLYVVAALHDEIGEEFEPRVLRLEPYRPDAVPAWAQDPGEAAAAGAPPPAPPSIAADEAIGRRLAGARAALKQHAAAALRPRAVPEAMSRRARVEAAAAMPGAAAASPPGGGARPPRRPAAGEVEDDRLDEHVGSRHGSVFGTVVHRALQLLLDGACAESAAALEIAGREAGLEEALRDEARRDVERALAVLERAGLLSLPRATELPLVLHENGLLLRGIIDLLVMNEDEILVIDYKTDRKQPGSLAAAYPQYAAQLRLYGRALRASGGAGTRRVRLGLLLTETGELQWLAEPPPPGAAAS